jgi:hypothetical protein
MEDLHRSFKYLNTSYLKTIVLIKLNVKFESPSSEILPRLVFNIYTFLIFPRNLGMYDSWLFEQVADIPLQVQDGLGHSICVSMLLLERPKQTLIA